MNSRVTLQDVAREAGVSSATVDRVLNARDGVRHRTREIVMSAAQRLGYIETPGAIPDAGEAVGALHLVFLLPAGTNAFMHVLRNQIETQSAERADLRVEVEMIEGFNPQTVAARLAELRGQVSGVGLVAQDHPLVREAIRMAAAVGTHIVTLASDIQSVPRIAYVGIDNRQAGRLAGHLLGRFLGQRPDAKVALFAGSMSYRGHEEREMGFRHILSEEFPDLRIVERREVMDDRQKAFAETEALLDLHPDLAAIYNVGAGTYGIAQALKTRGLDGRLLLVGHEATEDNKQLLLDGTLDAVIDQNPRVEAREALNLLSAAARGNPYSFVPLRLQVIFRENLPNE
ncbi:MAG: LacI family transcriptional regulator [Cereibacter sphaeroides]|uniref:LacI family transcriptional regulator n=1 Tax=Cereibacter sphaeroides TaxID=1063 RepID=A0A2W5S4X4_CERSP|nr:MAG: LacI family transcriptional regulator [Cereibacter sphaeroides]